MELSRSNIFYTEPLRIVKFVGNIWMKFKGNRNNILKIKLFNGINLNGQSELNYASIYIFLDLIYFLKIISILL